MVDEYEEIQHLREMWSSTMGRYDQIFIPIALGVLSLFLVNLPSFIDKNWGIQYLLIGGIVLTLFLIYWRVSCLHIDKQIVNFYPRLMEIEKSKDIHMQSSYYFKNLSKQSINFISSVLKNDYNQENLDCEKIKSMDYRKFKKTIDEIGNEIKTQDILLRVWDVYEYKSVRSRGHLSQNLFALIMILVYFLFVIIGFFLKWWINTS